MASLDYSLKLETSLSYIIKAVSKQKGGMPLKKMVEFVCFKVLL